MPCWLAHASARSPFGATAGSVDSLPKKKPRAVFEVAQRVLLRLPLRGEQRRAGLLGAACPVLQRADQQERPNLGASQPFTGEPHGKSAELS